MPVYDFFIKAGNTLPPIEAVLQDANGAVDLTGAVVRWKMRPEGTNVPPTVDGAADIVDADLGLVRYDWAAGDTDTPGIYEGEWEVLFLDGSIISFPNDRHLRVLVRAAVG